MGRSEKPALLRNRHFGFEIQRHQRTRMHAAPGRVVMGRWLIVRLAAAGFVLGGFAGFCALDADAAGAVTGNVVTSASTHQPCLALEAPPTATTSSAGSEASSNTTSVAIVVPAMVGVQLDSSGQPNQARTNTGTAPTCAAYYWVYTNSTNTASHRADLAQVNEVMASNLSGSWKSGAWHGVA
jgi:hypothetical protein